MTTPPLDGSQVGDRVSAVTLRIMCQLFRLNSLQVTRVSAFTQYMSNYLLLISVLHLNY